MISLKESILSNPGRGINLMKSVNRGSKLLRGSTWRTDPELDLVTSYTSRDKSAHVLADILADIKSTTPAGTVRRSMSNFLHKKPVFTFKDQYGFAAGNTYIVCYYDDAISKYICLNIVCEWIGIDAITVQCFQVEDDIASSMFDSRIKSRQMNHFQVTQKDLEKIIDCFNYIQYSAK